MNADQILEILRQVGAIITDSHIVCKGGKHSASYINKDMLYADTIRISTLCRILARKFQDEKVKTVIAPAIGGVILSQWVAYYLTTFTGKKVSAVYAEKENNFFVIKRGYDRFVEGSRVLVLEDVLTTGESARKVVVATRFAGGEVIGVGALCNRGGVTAKKLADVPTLFSLVNMNLEVWLEFECPMCKKGIPINTEVGHGREYLAQRGEKSEKML
ncbi:MAG: phosphoribosyltransferase [Candidatus Pacebacteria bacterium]|nr:phosphoribosyltransferase [Candidatus Paceibacterota bacterium]